MPKRHFLALRSKHDRTLLLTSAREEVLPLVLLEIWPKDPSMHSPSGQYTRLIRADVKGPHTEAVIQLSRVGTNGRIGGAGAALLPKPPSSPIRA